MKKPFISIIIPIYNCKPFLKRCLDSVFSQSFRDFEVICIDDGSKDEPYDIIGQYNVTYIHQENSGQSVARNAGIDIAKGEWLCFVDGDDSIQADYLSKMVEAIDDDVGMVVCGIRRIYEDGRTVIDELEAGDFDARRALITINPGPTNKLIRREAIKDSRFANCRIRYEDLLYIPELIVNAKKIVSIKDVLYDYYIHENTSMRSFDLGIRDIFTVLEGLMNKPFYKDYKAEIDYLVFKHAVFSHFSRIVYLDKKMYQLEMDNLRSFIMKHIPDYYQNNYIMSDRQPYFFVGTRLFRLNMLGILALPLKIIEKRIAR